MSFWFIQIIRLESEFMKIVSITSITTTVEYIILYNIFFIAFRYKKILDTDAYGRSVLLRFSSGRDRVELLTF